MSDIFAIQREIAEKLAARLQVALSLDAERRSRELPRSIPTPTSWSSGVDTCATGRAWRISSRPPTTSRRPPREIRAMPWRGPSSPRSSSSEPLSRPCGIAAARALREGRERGGESPVSRRHARGGPRREGNPPRLSSCRRRRSLRERAEARYRAEPTSRERSPVARTPPPAYSWAGPGRRGRAARRRVAGAVLDAGKRSSDRGLSREGRPRERRQDRTGSPGTGAPEHLVYRLGHHGAPGLRTQ